MDRNEKKKSQNVKHGNNEQREKQHWGAKPMEIGTKLS
jgi:hypothetical protein